MQDLGTFGGTVSWAYGINNSGQIVGGSNLSDNTQYYAYLDSGGGSLNQATDSLGTLGGNNSIAYGINNSGEVVGFADASNGHGHVYLYSGGTMHDLGTFVGGTRSQAYAINDNGQIAGLAYISSSAYHAFLHNGTSVVSLK